jgi:hypothetical protein
VLVILPLPVSPALLALYALRRGPQAGLVAVLVTLGAIAVLAMLAGIPATQMGVITGMMLLYLLPAAVGGALLSWTRDLSLAFQATSVGTLLAVLGCLIVFPSALQIGEFFREAWINAFAGLGVAEEGLEMLASVPPEEFLGPVLSSLFLTTLAGLMLGFWWFTQLQEGIGFGARFRELRLGRFASIVLVCATLAQFVPYAPLQQIAPLALVGFLFPGLAVMHSRMHSDNLHHGVPVLVYVLLLFPFTSPVMVLGLSAVGLLDNFFALRARDASRD